MDLRTAIKSWKDIRTLKDYNINHNSLVMVIFLIIVFGAILRFYDLGHNSFWTDEIKSIGDASRLTMENFFSPSSNAHPKLYFLLLHFWMKFGEGEFYLRSISVIFGLLLIVATYLLGKEIYTAKIGAFAALAVAFSPFHLLYDRELRMYSLFAFLSIFSLYFFLRSLRDNKRSSWIMYTLFTFLTMYTHYHAFLLIFAEYVYLCLNLKKFKRLLLKVIAANAVSGIIFMPWFVNGMFYHLQNLSPWTRGEDVFPIKNIAYILKPLYVLYSLCLGQTLLPWNMWGILGMLIFIVVGFISIVNFKKELKGNKFVLIVVAAVLVPGILISYAMPRYYIFLAPLLYLFFASSIERTKIVWLVSILFSGIMFCWVIGLNNYYKGRDFHILATIDPWREVGNYLTDNVQPKDLLINIGSGPLNYYLNSPHFPTLEGEAFEELKEQTVIKRWNNIWLVIGDPRLKVVSERVKIWLDSNYILHQEMRYLHDPEYLNKSKFFNKYFLEYRIVIYHYKHG